MNSPISVAARLGLLALGLGVAPLATAQWGGPPPGPYGVPYGVPQPPPARPAWGPPGAPRAHGPAAARAAAAAEDETRESARIVATTDWSALQTVTVELSEFRYAPDTLRFTAGQPYKLEMRNVGGVKHYFSAPEFLRAIATRKVQSNHDGEVKAPYFTAFEMMPNGGQLDLYFVPVRPGLYPVQCTVAGHTEQGMVGSVIIE